MARKKFHDESDNFLFPFQGIDLSTGINQQRPGTTPQGQNVRAYDAVSLRMSGGSRAGITPLFGQKNTTQVSGTNVVQHLNQIVWVSRAALSDGNGIPFANITAVINYAETNNPPPRNAPQVISSGNTWYPGTSPSFTFTSGAITTPDLPGDGMGQASFVLSTDGTNVNIVGTFIRAGFAPPSGGYFFSGNPQTYTLSTTLALWLPPASNPLAFAWTVVNFSLGFIANLFVNIQAV